MFGSIFDRLPASHFGMPERTSRQWILEQSNLAERILIKTPNVIELPIPNGKGGKLFTHALYTVYCNHKEPCSCADNDVVPWIFVEYFNIVGQIQNPAVTPDGLPLLNRLLGVDE